MNGKFEILSEILDMIDDIFSIRDIILLDGSFFLKFIINGGCKIFECFLEIDSDVNSEFLSDMIDIDYDFIS